MFGKEYAQHVDILTRTLGEINQKYKNKINIEKNTPSIVYKLKKLYISIFGIPEIGFQIRSLYFNKILNRYLSKKNPKRISDAGCGIGSYTLLLGKIFPKAKITGGDIDKNKLKCCQILAGELKLKNVEFNYLDLTKINNKNNYYDFGVCVDVLEHIQNYELALRNLSKSLKNGGYLYIHVPQPNQKRLFKSLREWHHEDHAHEGISRNELEEKLIKLGFKIIASKETFGFFGKLSWEINHLMISRNFVLAGLTFPILYVLGAVDVFWKNSNGLGIAVLAQKKK